MKKHKLFISALLILTMLSVDISARSGGGARAGPSGGGGGRGSFSSSRMSGHMNSPRMGLAPRTNIVPGTGFHGNRFSPGISNRGMNFSPRFNTSPRINNSQRFSTSPRLNTSPRLSSSPKLSTTVPQLRTSPRLSNVSPRLSTSPQIKNSRQFSSPRFSRGINSSSRFNRFGSSFDHSRRFDDKSNSSFDHDRRFDNKFSRFGSSFDHDKRFDNRFNFKDDNRRFNTSRGFINKRSFEGDHFINRSQRLGFKDSLWPSSASDSLWPAPGRLSSTARLGFKHFDSGFNRHDRDFIFRDHKDAFHRVPAHPNDKFPLRFNFGRHSKFGSYYPYYHQRYLFVGLGGYWPNYPYMRYHRYGGYPYTWYGYNPVPYEVPGYGYYSYYDPGYTEVNFDYDPFHDYVDVQKQEVQPDQQTGQQYQQPVQTTSDILFDNGVKFFGQGNYELSAQQFAQAGRLSPEDTVMPFAYVQSVFAARRYNDATAALRAALSSVTPQKAGVFFPRGLYEDENVLFSQIDELKEVQLRSDDSDLQLMLGYQLFGIGKTEEAMEHLEKARLDEKNRLSADILLTVMAESEKEKTSLVPDQSGNENY